MDSQATGEQQEWRVQTAFTTFAAMPSMIYQACLATGTPSNTIYIQEAVCAALARDLGLDYEDLHSRIPTLPPNHRRPHQGAQRWDFKADPSGGQSQIGPANTVEEVR